ncbi:carboxyl methyl esterase [Scheffersomyces amazonensis]|uniref:carboxyl methyl esterase n=1 Tax=Scheffersomyces amazonensis TaxID=1078765 RepID=UPI00315D53EA
MSDIQKALLRRIKQQEAAMGLSVLSEESESSVSPSPSPQPKSQSANPQTHTEDEPIITNYHKFKATFFDCSETFIHEGVSLQAYIKLPKTKDTQIFVLVHGAGSSSMTFAQLASNLIKEDSNVGIFIFDLRGHGDSSSTTDFSLSSLVEDCSFIIHKFIEKYDLSSNSLYFVGHSLGGAVIANFLKQPITDLNIRGEVILDIVEETAVKSLSSMPNFIENRPKSFNSITKAIDWHMNFLLFNQESANLSIPDLLDTNLHWKTDLSLTQPAWDTWFTGLSQSFLTFKGPKLLLLSAHETLDKNLIIGQMQGKYQLVVFNNNHNSGHFIHEDLPHQVAVCLLDFVKRNENPDKFMKDELGIVPKWGGKINK